MIGPGQAEVENLDLPLGRHLHVGWFQIPVNDALLVGSLQALGDLEGDWQYFVSGERSTNET